MAKYDITRSCGHEETVNIVGPVREREGKERFETSKLCAVCYAAEQATARRVAAEKAAAQAEVAGLPTLQGSEAQVAWALTIRARLLAEAAKLEAATRANIAKATAVRPLTPVEQGLANAFLAAIASIGTHADARYWIDHKDDAAIEIVKALTQDAADAARRAT